MPIHVLNATLAKQIQAAFLNFVFACTVQFTCTVANSASELHCSVFFFLVCIVFVYFFYKKTSFTLSCKQYFFS